MRQLDFVKKYCRYLINRTNRRDASTWVFGEWFGKRTGDNVTYFANYLAQAHPELELYWLCAAGCDTSALDGRIRILDYASEEAVAVSRRAAVAVMGEGIADLSPDISNYFGNAVKVNLWHGIPWKKIGHDAEKGRTVPVIEGMRRRMYRYDLFETPSDEYSSRVATGFDARPEGLVKAGLPRNRLFYDAEAVAACRDKLFQRIGAQYATVIAYLPTFRDAGTKPFSFTDVRDPAFLDWLEARDAVVIQKAHAAQAGDFEAGRGRVLNVPDIPAQELMAASDMLVTDYSSCFFDYLLLDRPIVHYLYDYDFYKDRDRGLYYGKEEIVCGSAPETVPELVRAIRENIENPGLNRPLREERMRRFMTYEGPDSCERIAERILKTLEESKR